MERFDAGIVVRITTIFCLVDCFDNCRYFHSVCKSPGNDFSGIQVHNAVKVYKTILRPDISYICALDSVRMFRIKLFVENVVEFFAKIRIFGGSSPRFSPLGTNAHFTHVFTYGALTDGFARFT